VPARAIGHGASASYFDFVTARHSSTDLVAGLEAGADDYLIKPCGPERIESARAGRGARGLASGTVSRRKVAELQCTLDQRQASSRTAADLRLLQTIS
jgi:DNA-binding response OmpR family regulator